MKKLHLLALTMLLSAGMMVQASDFGTDDFASDNSSDTSSVSGGSDRKAKFAAMKANSQGMTQEQKQAAVKNLLQQKMQNRSGNISARQQKIASMRAANGQGASDDAGQDVRTQNYRPEVITQRGGVKLQIEDMQQ